MTLHTLYETELNESREQRDKNLNKEDIRVPILIKRYEKGLYESNTVGEYGDNDRTFVYEMTNGQVGCLFLDDEHSILLNDMKATFWYIVPDKQNGWISKCFKQDIGIDTDMMTIPDELNKRLQYVKDCKLDMDLNVDKGSDMSMSMNMDGDVDIFIRKYTMYGHKIGDNEDFINLELYILSDSGTYQFNFKKERISIVIQKFGKIVTMVDHESAMTITDTYYNILWNTRIFEGTGDLKNRLYDKMFIIKDILKREMINSLK